MLILYLIPIYKLDFIPNKKNKKKTIQKTSPYHSFEEEKLLEMKC